MRGFSQHLAWDLAHGSSQAMPTGSSMTGLKAQERTEGQAGRCLRGPREAGTPRSIRDAPGPARGIHTVHRADFAFFLLVRPHPSLLGPGNGSQEEPQEPAWGSPLPDIGG